MKETIQLSFDDDKSDLSGPTHKYEGLFRKLKAQKSLNINTQSSLSRLNSQIFSNESITPISLLDSPKSSGSSFSQSICLGKWQQLASEMISFQDLTTNSTSKANLSFVSEQELKINNGSIFKIPSKSVSFSQEFYEDIEKFLDDQNLYIVDPACFYQPQKQNKTLLSLDKYKDVFLNGQIFLNELSLSSADQSPNISNFSNAKEPDAPVNTTNSFNMSSGPSLFNRRLERRSKTLNLSSNITCSKVPYLSINSYESIVTREPMSIEDESNQLKNINDKEQVTNCLRQFDNIDSN